MNCKFHRETVEILRSNATLSGNIQKCIAQRHQAADERQNLLQNLNRYTEAYNDLRAFARRLYSLEPTTEQSKKTLQVIISNKTFKSYIDRLGML